MKTDAIYRSLRTKTIIRYSGFVVLLAMFGAAILSNFVSTAQKASAAISVDGSGRVTIDGGGSAIYVIKSGGDLYQLADNIEFHNNTSTSPILDKRYYSYLADQVTSANCGGLSTCNLKYKDVTLTRGTFIMEGSQYFSNLTVGDSAVVTQPMSDRYGNINRPLYTGNFWGTRFVGFVSLPAESRTVLCGIDIDDGAQIEVGNGDVINNSTTWTSVYRWSMYQSDWGANFNGTCNGSAWDSASLGVLANPNKSTKYVPIRITFGENRGGSYANVYFNQYNLSNWVVQAQGYLPLSRINGVNGETMGASARADFSYYVSKWEQMPPSDMNNSRVVRTYQASNIDLSTYFDNKYGDYWNADRFQFAWTFGGESSNPIGSFMDGQIALQPHDGIDGPVNIAIASFRSGNGEINSNIMPNDRILIPAGLNLTVYGDAKFQNNGRIDLKETGYPGWYPFHGRGEGTCSVDGGSIYKDGKPGGGRTACSNDVGSGGSNGGVGATSQSSNVVSSVVPTNPKDPNVLGSGGGGSEPAGGRIRTGGGGGGLLKMRANNIIADSVGSISAVGGIGPHPYDEIGVAGGSGGTINIRANQIGGIGSLAIADGASKTGSPFNYSFSAGGGGYIYVGYCSAIGNILNSVTARGGTGARNGNDGVIRTELLSSGGTCTGVFEDNLFSNRINKQLVAYKRPYNSTATDADQFNPYALQSNDLIRVEITVSNMNMYPNIITDNILATPTSTKKCIPDDTNAPNPFISDGGLYNSLMQQVNWTFTPRDTADAALHTFYYYCKVSG